MPETKPSGKQPSKTQQQVTVKVAVCIEVPVPAPCGYSVEEIRSACDALAGRHEMTPEQKECMTRLVHNMSECPGWQKASENLALAVAYHHSDHPEHKIMKTEMCGVLEFAEVEF